MWKGCYLGGGSEPRAQRACSPSALWPNRMTGASRPRRESLAMPVRATHGASMRWRTCAQRRGGEIAERNVPQLNLHAPKHSCRVGVQPEFGCSGSLHAPDMMASLSYGGSLQDDARRESVDGRSCRRRCPGPAGDGPRMKSAGETVGAGSGKVDRSWPGELQRKPSVSAIKWKRMRSNCVNACGRIAALWHDVSSYHCRQPAAWAGRNPRPR
jgi:hypothetical protein